MAENDTSKARIADQANTDEKPKKVRYHLLKSNSFRTIYADGVFGGVTPRLNISATFFNERHPLPDQMVHAIKEDGTISDEIRDERITRDGIVRELEANVIMDVEFAKVLADWLKTKIEFIEKTVKEAKEDAAKQEQEKVAEEAPNAVAS
jgi:hypothetical protein